MQQMEKQAISSLVLNISQVAKSLDLSRGKVYQLIDQEGLPIVMFGRTMRVLPSSLQKWLEQREEVR